MCGARERHASIAASSTDHRELESALLRLELETSNRGEDDLETVLPNLPNTTEAATTGTTAQRHNGSQARLLYRWFRQAPVSALFASHIESALEEALRTRKPFRAFREALREFEEVEQCWSQFADNCDLRSAGRWLKEKEIDLQVTSRGASEEIMGVRVFMAMKLCEVAQIIQRIESGEFGRVPNLGIGGAVTTTQ